MHSPKTYSRQTAPLWPLLAKELREITSGRALWTMLLLLCPLIGYSFLQAVSLYGEASSAALQSPVLANSLSPLDGVLVPTLGSFYVAVTLLFPFVAIRALGQEKETGALRLLVQLPYRPSTLVSAKLAAVLAAWMLASIPALSTLIVWRILGGHLAAAETANLLFGHLVYGLLVGALALFSASIAESAATAAIIALAITIGSWVLDFTVAGNPGLLSWFAQLSLTQTLRPFEQGLLSGGLVLGAACVIFGLIALATVWLPPGVPPLSKTASLAAVAGDRSADAQRRGPGEVDGRRHRGQAKFLSFWRSKAARDAAVPFARDRASGSRGPALCRPATQCAGKTGACNAKRIGHSRKASARFLEREQRRILWRGRIRLWRSIRHQPINESTGDPAAALRARRRFASRASGCR